MTKHRDTATLFIGDINVDVMMGGLAGPPVPDCEIACTSFDVVMGSTAVLAAVAYRCLGGNTAFLGLAGRDEYGDFMVGGLRELGIHTDLVRRTDQVKTGVTVNMVHGRQRTQVTYPGTIAEFDGADIDGSVFDGIRHVHFAGPYQQTRFRPHISGLLRTARQRSVTTSLDPQWDETERWEYMDEWLTQLDYIFLNEDEALSITGARSPEAACHALTSDTCTAVVKLGRRGALVLADGAAHVLPPIDVPVTDTTGAGDNFDGGFLYAALEAGLPPLAAMAFANAVASRSCMFVGGTGARSGREDVRRLMEENA